MEEEEDEEEDWETSFSTPRHSDHSRRHNYSDDLSIFPPINHEGLPTIPPPPPPPPPPHARVCLSSSDSDTHSQPTSPHPSKTPPHSSHLPKWWFHFAFHICISKLLSFLARIRSLGLGLGFWSLFRLGVFVVPFLGVLWFWVRRRRRRCGGIGQESVERLKLVVKEKDEKIIQLLEQIAQMNKLLLARYRIPVLKSS